jgi:hypothetical protein
MCEHKERKGKGKAAVVGLCRKCSSDERFDRFQIRLLERQTKDNWWKLFQKVQVRPIKRQIV